MNQRELDMFDIGFNKGALATCRFLDGINEKGEKVQPENMVDFFTNRIEKVKAAEYHTEIEKMAMVMTLEWCIRVVEDTSQKLHNSLTNG